MEHSKGWTMKPKNNMFKKFDSDLKGKNKIIILKIIVRMKIKKLFNI